MSDDSPPLPQAADGAKSAPSRWLRSETLAQGMFVMIAMTGGQRLIGFVRGVLFCRWLPPEELGTWDLAFGFLLLAAPLAVLGIPGVFGRYVEHYRQRGQLHAFLRNTTLISALLAVTGVAMVAAFRGWFGWFIFDDPSRGSLVLLLSVCLIAVIANNFLIELFTALRQMRIVSVMGLANSMLFAALGITLLFGFEQNAAMVVVAYAVACVATALLACYALWRTWGELPTDGDLLRRKTLWAKLVPFAAWVWMTNLLTNLFAISDRYMILHFSGLDATAAAVLVGNYHSSRVVPLLLVSLAGMVSAMLLPHLSHDWEAGRREFVSGRLNLMVKSFGLAFMAAAVAIMAFAPLLFSIVLAGKYTGGLEVLPWTLTYCVWFSLSMIAEVYLWCAERPRLACLTYFVGLLVNIGLNIALVPVWGLYGAVVATAAGNAVALVLALVLSQRLGLAFDPAVWLIAALPLALLLGLLPAATVLLIVAWLAYREEWIFSGQQKQALVDSIRPYSQRFVRACYGLRQALTHWPST